MTSRRILSGTLQRAASPLALLCMLPATPASARVELNPWIELRQVFDLPIDDDFTTYSEAAIGVNGSVETRRVRGQLSYRFGQRLEEVGNVDNHQTHSLVARANADVIPETLSIDAGAFASLMNSNYRNGASFDPNDDNNNLAQTFSVFAAPSFHRRLGGFAEFDAKYRIGYVDVNETNAGQFSNINNNIFGTYADSINQSLQLRLGNREASSRFRWDLIGDAQDEHTDHLDQRYRSYLGRLELEYALNRDFALLGSVGYEDIRSTQDSILTDAAGIPIVDADGNFIVDPDAPRHVSYDQAGMTYDGGFRWSPSHRTFFLLRVGKRFGKLNVSSQLRYQPSPRLAMTASWSESLSTFGQLLTQDFNGVPVSFFISGNNPVGVNGCILGVDPATGQCLFNWTQSITNATFRNQAGQFIVEMQRGKTRAALTTIYTTRRYVDTQQLQGPGSPPVDPTLAHRSDKTLSITASTNTNLGEGRALDLAVYGARYKFALSRARADYYIGTSATYRHAITRRLEAHVSGHFTQRFSEISNDHSNAIVAVGLLYRF